ncbi:MULTISPECIES: hypothetical protein [unclassified Leucobacter]|uniref:hypothetical protein n=1 Tax=unclassified Leucobacter TaxID=2621730 RepID=UPI00301810A0
MSPDPWELTRTLSPRPTVRVAAVDAAGAVQNLYDHTARTAGEPPATTWAMYLADRAGFRFLAFDLDAKTAGARAAAARDAELLAQLLVDAGLQPLVCESGPSGGRHVWAAFTESVDAELVAIAARLAKALCPTLDLSPLTNPATGCVRPPGAPHRSGGASRILTGDVDVLSAPAAGTAQLRAFIERLAVLVDDIEPAAETAAHVPVPIDEHARPYLPGPKRDLPSFAAAALRQDAASGDASAVLWRVLIGAAAARWRHADVAELVPTAPGLEHIRTSRNGGDRAPRRPGEAAALLRRQWDKAVRHVASTRSSRVGSDDTFDERAAAIAKLVRDAQTRADATAGRWTHGGGPTDRRILDVLSVLVLRAVSASVEADTRRLALLAGIGRETARMGLQRLAEDGWITRTRVADGPHGAHWRINETPVIHRETDQARSQANPAPPAGAGSAERTALLHELEDRMTAAAHDLFTLAPGLGHFAGNVYARTRPTEPTPIAELAHATGGDAGRTARALQRLAGVGVLQVTRAGHRRLVLERRDLAAEQLGISGRLAERRERYSIERELWAWWQAEVTWMEAPVKERPRRRPGPGQLELVPMPGVNAFGAHPRKADGTADYRMARAYVAGTPLPEPSAPMAPVLQLVTDAERLIMEVLGGTLVETRPLPPPERREQPEPLRRADPARQRERGPSPRFVPVEDSA